MRLAVLWDLDGTLIDTSALDSLREARNWKRCVKELDKTRLFPNTAKSIRELQSRGVAMAVVTSSVSYYASALLVHHGLDKYITTLVAFHDYRVRKPSPACVEVAFSRLNVSPDAAFGVGDAAVDAGSYRAAGLLAVGAGWSPSFQPCEDWGAVAGCPSEVVRYLSA